MATVATQTISPSGSAITYSNATADTGDRFTPSRHTFLHVVNGSGGSINVTIVTPGTVDGLAIADRVVAVGAGANRMIACNTGSYTSGDGLADVTWSSATSVTFAVIKI